MVDELAEKLERAGLYRRAARRWTDVQMNSECDDMRDEAVRRRNACLVRSSCRKKERLKPDVSMAAFIRAVDGLHKRMGLDLPARDEHLAGGVVPDLCMTEQEGQVWMILNSEC